MQATLAAEHGRTPPAFRSPSWDLAAPGLAGALALLGWLLGWRGGDLPAQLYRIGRFRAEGFTVWDNQWYAGHHTLGYSFLLPVAGALLGAALVGAVSAVVAAWAFDRLVRGWVGERAMGASLLFAAGTAVNLAIGRLPFAFGLAIGLVALLAVARGQTFLAGGLALICGLASPVASAFLALAGGALALTAWTDAGTGRDRIRRSRPGLVLAVMAVLPVLAFAVLFPEGGTFPFDPGALVVVLGSALAVWWSVDARPVRVGAALYGAVSIPLFLAANPLGGNMSRLGMMCAAPLVLCGARRRRPLVVVALVTAVLVWQWSPALDAIVGGAGSDPSASASYYPGVLDFLRHQPGPLRVEVPMTRHHWEVVHVAPTVALVRGWERQLDRAYSGLFYGRTLDASTYESWLRDGAVSYVALPDVALDPSSDAEATLLRGGLPGLAPVWSDRHWRVWRVNGARPLASAPGRLLRVGTDSFTLTATEPGQVTVRIRYTPYWQVSGASCVRRAPGGWTLIALQPGVVTVRATLAGRLPWLGARPRAVCSVR